MFMIYSFIFIVDGCEWAYEPTQLSSAPVSTYIVYGFINNLSYLQRPTLYHFSRILYTFCVPSDFESSTFSKDPQSTST